MIRQSVCRNNLMQTKIIKINKLDEEALFYINEAASFIKQGGLVVFPTETVYGLGGDGTNSGAAMKIYAAKGRPSDNPLIIHISNPSDAEKYTCTNPIYYYKLADAFMPGPLTVVLPAKETVPKETRGGLSTVAVRCPLNIIARKLIEKSGVPIAAPSANISGSPSPTRASHVIDDMNGRVDMIIDGGDCDLGIESTIVKIDDDGGLTLLRPGCITVDDLRAVCPVVRIADAVVSQLKDEEKAISPGMKYRHYAPKSPLFLLDGAVTTCIEYLLSIAERKKIAVICYNDDESYYRELSGKCMIYNFGNRNDEITQAHRLFDILREADKMNFDEIYAPLPSQSGVGLAIYNRMIRAAAHHIIRM